MNLIVLLAVGASIGANDEPVKLWSGKYDGVSLTLYARKAFESTGVAKQKASDHFKDDLPPYFRTSLVEYWLETERANGTETKCLWRQVSVNSPAEAIGHLREDGVLGIVFFDNRQDSRWHHYFALTELDLKQKLSEPPITRPTTVVGPPRDRRSGGIGFKDSYPLRLIATQIMGVDRELRGYEPTLRRLSFVNGRWKLKLCIRGVAIDFEREKHDWIVSEGDQHECSDVPPQATRLEPLKVRAPHPGANPNGTHNEQGSGFGGGGFGSDGGFGRGDKQ